MKSQQTERTEINESLAFEQNPLLIHSRSHVFPF